MEDTSQYLIMTQSTAWIYIKVKPGLAQFFSTQENSTQLFSITLSITLTL